MTASTADYYVILGLTSNATPASSGGPSTLPAPRQNPSHSDHPSHIFEGGTANADPAHGIRRPLASPPPLRVAQRPGNERATITAGRDQGGLQGGSGPSRPSVTQLR